MTTRFRFPAGRLAILVLMSAGLVAGGLFLGGESGRENAPAVSRAAEDRGPPAGAAIPTASDLPAQTVPHPASGAASDIARASVPDPVVHVAPFADVLPGVDPATDWISSFPARIKVAAVPGAPIEFSLVSAQPGAGFTTWIAGSQEIEGALLVGTTANGGIDFIQSIPGANEVAISVRGSRVVVTEKPHNDRGCGQEALTGAAAAAAIAPGGTEVHPATGATHIGDLLVLYDAGTLTKASASAADHDGAAFLLTTARNQIALTNTAFANSLITAFQWRVVGVAKIPAYTRTGKMEDDLDQISGTSTEVGRFTDAKARELGADDWMLWVDGTSDYAGIAWVSSRGAIVQWSTDYRTLAHELGHNLGCRHDRQTAKATDGDGQWHYGHRFTHNGKDCGDIMSYAPYCYGRFSNPAVTADIGTLFPASYGVGSGTVTLGVAETEPKAANCARTITSAASGIANFRASVVGDVPAIAAAPAAATVTAGGRLTLSVTATGGALSYQWRRNGVAIAGATGSTYTVDSTTPADAGSYDCVVSNPLGSVTTAAVAVTVNQIPPPVIAGQPAAKTLTEGGAFSVSVTATTAEGTLSYQWRRNGVAIAGATSATYSIAAATTWDAGDYDCVVRNSGGGSVTSAAAAITILQASGRPIPAAPPNGRLLNISARAHVGTGGDVLIGGVIVQGGRARILVRASGPALTALGVAGALGDPMLTAFTATGTQISRNLDWGDAGTATALRSEFTKAGAFAWTTGSKDACLLLTLDPGCYTFHVAGQDGGTGVGLLEIYLVGDSGLPGHLVNLSARARSGRDADALIAGVIASGATQVAVRGIGPALEALGVTGALRKPSLKAFTANSTLVDEVQKWSTTYSYSGASALFSRLGAFALTSGSDDALSVMNLAASDPIRTFMCEGSDGGSGVALVEVYLVRP